MSPKKANKPAPNKTAGEHPGAAVKEGWETKKVREIAKHSLGKMLDKAKNRGDLQPYLRNLNVRWFDFDLTDVLEMRFLPEESEKYTAKKGDVLICEGGYPGRAAIWENDEPIYFQKALHRVRFYEPEHTKWFLYYLLSKDLDGTLKNHFNGAGIQHFTGEALAQFEVPLPPLPEQKRIVALLDEAFAGIATAKANAEKNLQNARALFESHLQAVFTQRGPGWVEKSIGDVCDLLNGFAFRSGDSVQESQTQLIRMGNLYGNRLNLDRSPVFYPDNFAAEYQRYLLIEGDLIMSLTGTTGKEDYGYVVTVPKCEHTLLMNQRIAKFDSIRNELVVRDFLLYYLRSRAFLDDLYPTANGTRQANLSSVTIKTLPIPLCSIEKQNAIADGFHIFEEEMQRLTSIYEKKIAALDALKKALLRQAFSGEL